MKKKSSLKAWNWFWTSFLTIVILFVLVDAGTRAFWGFNLINWIAFKNEILTRTILGIAGIVGFVGLLDLVVNKVYRMIKG